MFKNENETHKSARQIRGNDAQCPHCKADLWEFEPFDNFEGGSFSQGWTCSECGTNGIFTYTYKVNGAFYTRPDKKEDNQHD